MINNKINCFLRLKAVVFAIDGIKIPKRNEDI